MKFSLITVCYNSANTIEDTFRSVLKQTYQNFEYIVIDGCSTDKTVELIKNMHLFSMEKCDGFQKKIMEFMMR